LKRQFSKEWQYMKKCSAYLAIMEMQIKTALRLPAHFSCNNNHQETTNAGENMRRKEPLYTLGGNVN
jgi:hypothetical protein